MAGPGEVVRIRVAIELDRPRPKPRAGVRECLVAADARVNR